MDISILSKLFENIHGSAPLSISSLPPSGSARKYFRMQSKDHSVIGVFNQDIPENNAFLYFTQHFLAKGLPVPKILAAEKDSEYYLLEDLGDLTLKEHSDILRKDNEFPDELMHLYKQALSYLVKFQLEGHKDLNYSYCIPRDTFDKQSVLWDLNHFKYFFLKLSGISFNEQKLENDFQSLAEFLMLADSDNFLFRDFQSRNIMLHKDQLYFIDYQGGRKGALHYDPASLLFEAKTNLPPELRESLLDFYLSELSKFKKTDPEKFRNHYYAFVLIRILQALGAYGLRGLIEKKSIFLQSITPALKNLKWLIENASIPIELPELYKIISKLESVKKFNLPYIENKDILTVNIFSFSYRKGIPDDLSGHGGGFVFDCRGIHNPGRYNEYKELTGKDISVAAFLQEKSKMNDFLKDISNIVNRHIEFYKSNNYYNMQISFGCTGGRHRSVYAAEAIAAILNSRNDLRVILKHTEI
jgi:aminoglycoside/choline kinase family phosphotransferase